MTIGERVQELLKSQQKSKIRLADYIGSNKSTVGKWGKERNPSSEYIEKIAEFFGVSMQYVLTGNDDVEWGIANDIEERIEQELKKANKTKEALCNACNLTPTIFSTSGTFAVNKKEVKRIADYLAVETNDLLGWSRLAKDEIDLLHFYRKMNTEGKEFALAAMGSFANDARYKKHNSDRVVEETA